MKHIAICMLFVFGCGEEDEALDGSGLDPATPLGQLSASERSDACEYGVSLSRTVVCDGENVESVADMAGCLQLLSNLLETCEATVEELESCFEDLAVQSDDDVCSLVSVPASCSFLGDPTCLDL